MACDRPVMLAAPVYICDAVRTPFGRYGEALGVPTTACGEAAVAITASLESISRARFGPGRADEPFSRPVKFDDTKDTTLERRLVNPLKRVQHGTDSMAETTASLAGEFRVNPAYRYGFAPRTRRRHARSPAAGFFDDEPAAMPGEYVLQRRRNRDRPYARSERRVARYECAASARARGGRYAFAGVHRHRPGDQDAERVYVSDAACMRR